MVEEKSPYELLRVAPTASQDEVRAAYKSTALQNHPDRGGDPLAWAAIQRAYDTLVDAQKRAVYDRTRQGPATNAEASFTQSFGEGAFDLRDEAAASSAAPSTPKGMNIEAQVANAGTLANTPSGGGLSHGAGFDAWMRNQKGLGKVRLRRAIRRAIRRNSFSTILWQCLRRRVRTARERSMAAGPRRARGLRRRIA